ncbi:MAG: hypothetical protein NVSMB47_21600 [Polyangiales bacterium]
MAVAPADGAAKDSGDVGTGDGARDSGALADALDDVPADTLVDDTGAELDAFPDVSSDADPCDRDGDGFKADSCEPDPTKADCNDYTPQAHPQTLAGFVHAPTGDPSHWRAGGIGDWDCNGTVEKEITKVASCASGSTLDCSPAHDGVGADVACGAATMKITCKVDSILGACKDGVTDSFTMGCR